VSDRPPRVVKFVKAEVETVGKERCRARVELKREPDRSYFGSAEGPATELDKLRSVAQATGNALLQAVTADEGTSVYEIRVKELAVQDAFGKKTVLVSVAGVYFKQRRDLLGLCAIEGDAPRAAALAVLNACNRFLGVG